MRKLLWAVLCLILVIGLSVRSEQEQQLKLKFCFSEWQAEARSNLSREF
jgi:hypothetical protein